MQGLHSPPPCGRPQAACPSPAASKIFPLPRTGCVCKSVSGEKYLLLERMNCSDFAEVYKAQNCYSPEGSYPVVVKISRGDNEAANAQLEREKAALARVKHMNVVNLLDAGVSPSFLVLEYVPGYNLRSEIPACQFGHDPVHEILNPRQSAMRKPPSWRRTRCIMLQTSIALAAAHAVNVYHCDIKPENLLIYGRKRDPLVKLSDFGVAEVVDNPMALASGEDTFGVTPYYAPLEAYLPAEEYNKLYSGKLLTLMKGAWDTYGMGAVLYELLTGTQPYYDKKLSTFDQLMGKMKTERLLPPSSLVRDLELPKKLDALAMAALDKDPLARCSIEEFKFQLESIDWDGPEGRLKSFFSFASRTASQALHSVAAVMPGR